MLMCLLMMIFDQAIPMLKDCFKTRGIIPWFLRRTYKLKRNIQVLPKEEEILGVPG